MHGATDAATTAPPERVMSRRRAPLAARISRLLLPLHAAFAVSYLFLPIIVMIVFSFNDPRGRLPGILAAALLSFALSIDDYVITSFVAGQTTTFPLWVYGASRFGLPPEVNVLGTLIFVVASSSSSCCSGASARPSRSPANP